MNDVAAAAITAFAPGAGPPEKMMPTRRTPSPLRAFEELAVILICSCDSVRRFADPGAAPEAPCDRSASDSASSRWLLREGHRPHRCSIFATFTAAKYLERTPRACHHDAAPVSVRGMPGLRREPSRSMP